MSRTTTTGYQWLRRRAGFTLVELLVVVAIIALLMGILIPSLKGARNAAKRSAADNTIKVLSGGLTMFKDDNEGLNPQTNGYPESAFAEDSATKGTQKIYGAHWLVRSLVGKDFNGYIPRRVVPVSLQNRDNPIEEQLRWYAPEAGDPRIDRIAPYIPVDSIKTVITEDLKEVPEGLPGPSDPVSSPTVRHAPVFVDPWGSPFLYYAANSFGKTLCVNGQPGPRDYFNHVDNQLFTGSDVNANFAGVKPDGGIKRVCPGAIIDIDHGDPTWARYIHNDRLHEQANVITYKPVPYNRDSFLLISGGRDNNYGTKDDVNNFAKK